MEPLRAGDPVRVGNFVLRGRLGAGGMGEVFLGHTPGGRAVAVKMVHPHLARETEFRVRFRREVAAARAVSGAFTASVVAAGPNDDPPWIATTYVRGPSLSQAVTTTTPLPDGSMWPLAAGLVEALQAIHAEDLLHRDLKPSNVLLAPDGPRVIDFGIARALDATRLTGTGTAIGTPGFMSPEQAEGNPIGLASDVFSLGAVLAFAATGSEPFGQGPPAAVLYRVVTSEPQLAGLHGPLRALISACLAKSPADRPTTAQLLDQITSQWDPPGDFADITPWPRTLTELITTQMAPSTAQYTELAATPPPPLPPASVTAAREDLADRYRQAQRTDHTTDRSDARQLMAELVADYVRVLGPDHLDTLRARHRHAWDLGEAGERAEAARLMAEVATDRARVLGPDHPDTLMSRFGHAWDLGKAGDRAEAARLMAEVATDRARVLGP
ncbi:protein kinase, partial [Streptomyces sp. NPDC050507]|uniref:serine/threonine-protein kinase n=1 Tax=Streptomyces sp. NPDC050507 TaxID=3365619 RepID=UPI003799548C